MKRPTDQTPCAVIAHRQGVIFRICADDFETERDGRAAAVEGLAEVYGESVTHADLVFLRYVPTRSGLVAVFTRHGSDAHFLNSRRKAARMTALQGRVGPILALGPRAKLVRRLARNALDNRRDLSAAQRAAFEHLAQAGLWNFNPCPVPLP